MDSRKPTTAVDRVRARLAGKGPKGGSGRHRPHVLPFRHIEVTVVMHYAQKEHLFKRSFRIPSHKDGNSNTIRTKLTAETITEAKRANAAFGNDLKVTLRDYRII